MRTLINKNIKSSSVKAPYVARRELNNNSMKREIVFPVIVGIIFGALIMIFWQFTASLNNQNARLAQLEQVTGQNSQTVNDIVTFINQATNPQGGAQGAPTAPTTK